MRTLTATDVSDAQRVAGSTRDLGGIHPTLLPFVQWFAPPPRRQKQGHPADRKAVADFIRAQRARLPELKGDWTLRTWSIQVHIAGRNKLAQLTARRKKLDEPQDRMTADDSDWGEPDADILEYGSGRERGELDSQTVGVRNRG